MNDIAQEEQVLTIPKGYFVVRCDFDKEEPTITLHHEYACDCFDEMIVPAPKALAYYLKTHGCGSKIMRNIIENQGKREVRNAIKEALGI